MAPGLLALVQLIQGHDLGNTHCHGFSGANANSLDLVFPCLDLSCGVGLFRKRLDLLGVECQGSLTTAQTVIDSLAALAETLKGICRPHLLPQKELGNAAGIFCRLHLCQEVNGILACLIHMLEHGVHMEAVHLHDILFQGADHLAQILQFLSGHLIDNKLTVAVINDVLSGIHKPVQILHEVRRQIGVVGIHLVHFGGAVHHLFQPAQLLHKGLVRCCGVTTLQLALTHEVDRRQEGDHRVFQRIRNVLYHALVVRVQHPVGQFVHIATDSVTVLLDSCRVIPAVSPALQHFLSMLPLLLLHNNPCLLQNTLQDCLFLHAQHIGTGGLDLTVKYAHTVQGIRGGRSVHLGTKLLLLVEPALFCSFGLQGFQLAQALLEDVKSRFFLSGQIIHTDLAGCQGKHLTVCHGVCTLLQLLKGDQITVVIHDHSAGFNCFYQLLPAAISIVFPIMSEGVASRFSVIQSISLSLFSGVSMANTIPIVSSSGTPNNFSPCIKCFCAFVNSMCKLLYRFFHKGLVTKDRQNRLNVALQITACFHKVNIILCENNYIRSFSIFQARSFICIRTKECMRISGILRIVDIIPDIAIIQITSTLFLNRIIGHTVKSLFLLGIQDLHDLIVASTLLVQLSLLGKGLCNQLCLLSHILTGRCKLILPLCYRLADSLHSCNKVVDHVGGVARIGVEIIALLTRDQAPNAIVSLNNTKVKACKLTDGGVAFLVSLGGSLSHQRNTGFLFIGEFLLTNGNGEFALGIGVHSGSCVYLAVFDHLFQDSNSALVCFQTANSICHSAAVCSAQTFQFLDIGIQLHLLHNQRATGSQCFDLSSRKGYFAGVLGLTAHILAVHNLVDKVLLSLQDIPQTGIEAALRNIGEVFHFIIDVTLAVCSAVTLLHIAGPPRRVQMVNRHNALLGIHTYTHLAGRTDQHSYLAVVHIRKQLLFLGISVCLMDKGNLLGRDTALHQSGLDIVVELCALHIGFHFLCLGICNLAFTLGGSHIAEDKLCALDIFTALVHAHHIISAAVDLATFLIRKARVDHALGVGNLSAVAGDFQHVIHAGVNIFDVVRSLFQLLHVVLLELSRLTDHNIALAALHLGDFQTGNIGQHIREVTEQQLQLAHVLKPGEALLHAVALSAGLDLHAVDNFTELLCPGIEGGKPQLVQQIRL